MHSPLGDRASSPCYESEHCVHWGTACFWKKAWALSRIYSHNYWDSAWLSTFLALFLQLQKAALHCLRRPRLPHDTYGNIHSSLPLSASHSSLFLGFPSNWAPCYSITNILHSWGHYYTYHPLPFPKIYALSSLQILPLCPNRCHIVTASSPGTGRICCGPPNSWIQEIPPMSTLDSV